MFCAEYFNLSSSVAGWIIWMVIGLCSGLAKAQNCPYISFRNVSVNFELDDRMLPTISSEKGAFAKVTIVSSAEILNLPCDEKNCRLIYLFARGNKQIFTKCVTYY